MQVHALVEFGPASNLIARLNWFANIKYVVGGQEYSSNDIEHGVLRNNKPSPANLLSLVGLSSIAPKTFQPRDPRLSQVPPVHASVRNLAICVLMPKINTREPQSLSSRLKAKLWNSLHAHAVKGLHESDHLLQIVDPEDPRIHFALVCGAKSCPPIKVG